jgi:hypothetical protein
VGKTYDYIPAGKIEKNGKLVNKPPDPYVTIEIQALKIKDLQRRIDMGENAGLQAGNEDLRAENGRLVKEIENLKLTAEGAMSRVTELEKERDDLANELKIAKSKIDKRAGKGLPEITTDVEAIAAANRAKDEALEKVAALEAQIEEFKKKG